MKNVYLIFPNPNDVTSYCRVECERKDFVDALIEAEVIESWDDLKGKNWIIFENSILEMGCEDFL